jgi:hypothetical protein
MLDTAGGESNKIGQGGGLIMSLVLLYVQMCKIMAARCIGIEWILGMYKWLCAQ